MLKRKQSQAEMIKNLTNRELMFHLYLSQVTLGVIAFFVGFFLFDRFASFFWLFECDVGEVFFYGGGAAVIVIVVDLLLMKWLPKRLFDDGGMNERLFSMLPVWHIFVISLMIAIVEESLFRGVLQTHIGVIPASLIFVVIHVRYLKKPFLLSVTMLLSFLLGGLFLYTENLFVPMFTHFFIDFIFGIIIRKKIFLSGG